MSKAWRGVMVGRQWFVPFRPVHYAGPYWYCYGWHRNDNPRKLRRLVLTEREAMEWYDRSRT